MFFLIREAYEHHFHFVVRDHLDERSKFVQEVIFESESLEAVEDHRDLACAKEGAWHPGCVFLVFFDGAFFDDIETLAKELDTNVPRLKKLLHKYRTWVLPWPNRMGDVIDGFVVRNPLCK